MFRYSLLQFLTVPKTENSAQTITIAPFQKLSSRTISGNGNTDGSMLFNQMGTTDDEITPVEEIESGQVSLGHTWYCIHKHQYNDLHEFNYPKESY